ncbi:hypothetical protein DPMN_122580 [Dreissena polymorpha]|uniref:Uncharacterized protein n=1 Tax=Dreissena polymorpha TaxID=45954 RepID=A0A9D4GNU8_DREPO|nr:hypothetical protein DPMN_122580 [Dreissena polymorpha]
MTVGKLLKTPLILHPGEDSEHTKSPTLSSNERNSNETFIECGLGYRNCSQKLRRFDCDNELFNCSVGGKDGKTFALLL